MCFTKLKKKPIKVSLTALHLIFEQTSKIFENEKKSQSVQFYRILQRISLILNIVLITVLNIWSLYRLFNLRIYIYTYIVLWVHYFMLTLYRLLDFGIPNDIKPPFYSIIGDRQLTRSKNNKYFCYKFNSYQPKHLSTK